MIQKLIRVAMYRVTLRRVSSAWQKLLSYDSMGRRLLRTTADASDALTSMNGWKLIWAFQRLSMSCVAPNLAPTRACAALSSKRTEMRKNYLTIIQRSQW